MCRQISFLARLFVLAVQIVESLTGGADRTRQTEIANFDGTIHIQQDVGGLQIAMPDTHRVKIVDATTDAVKESARMDLVEVIVGLETGKLLN